MGEWLPIETAPYNTEVLICAEGGGSVEPCGPVSAQKTDSLVGGHHIDLWWDWGWIRQPTHWMPLPAPPHNPTQGEGSG